MSLNRYSQLVNEVAASDTVAMGLERMAVLLRRVMNDHLETHGPPPGEFESGLQTGYDWATSLVESAAEAFARRDAT